MLTGSTQLAKHLGLITNCFFINLNNNNLFALTNTQHAAYLDKAGHIPYSNEGDEMLADVVLRHIHVASRATYKVIVADCDNTLWTGLCAEGRVTLSEGQRFLQAFLLQKRKEGFLIALCSKNDEVDVVNVFKTNVDMLLKLSDIVAIYANWNTKVSNIKLLSQELSLSVSSFIYLDDSTLECEGIENFCPEACVINIPTIIRTKAAMFHFLHTLWVFDVIPDNLTIEDKHRTEFYQENVKRVEKRNYFSTLDAFIASLQVNYTVSTPKTEDITRVRQLILRTAQFNLSCNRALATSFSETIKDSIGKVVTASDKYGDYGLIGFIRYGIKANILHLYDFILSCRVLGRGLEFKIAEYFVKEAKLTFCENIIFYYSKGHNSAIHKFLAFLSGNPKVSDQAICLNVNRLSNLLGKGVNYDSYYRIDMATDPKQKNVNKTTNRTFDNNVTGVCT